MIGYYNYTILFTFFGTVSGLLGIQFALSDNILASLICLLICGFFDMFDGTVARTKKNRTEFEKKYGVQLDSLSDVVCFAVLPTIIALEVTKPLGWWSNLCLLYFITSISRLAYFNVEEEMRSKKESTPRKIYTGLPVTMTSVILPCLYFIGSMVNGYLSVIMLIGILANASLQVSKIKIPHLQKRGLLTCLLIGSIILILTILTQYLF